jgi:hypothetical protein
MEFRVSSIGDLRAFWKAWMQRKKPKSSGMTDSIIYTVKHRKHGPKFSS